MQAVPRHADTPTHVAWPGALHSHWRVLRTVLTWLTACIVFPLCLTACGGSDSAAPATSVTAVIGAAGGTVTGPDGVQVIVPAGALNQATTIGIARSSDGAPAPLAAYAVSGHVYELTPHGLNFNVPVTVRAPLGNTADTQVFMASPGEDWRPMSASLTNGVAEWERSSFSWMYTGGCSVPTSMVNDPYWCATPLTAAFLTATPSSALVQTAFARDPARGDWGAYRVDQATNLQFRQHVRVPGNCSNVSVKLLRRRYVDIVHLYDVAAQTLATQSPVMVADAHYLNGDAIFAMPFTSVDSDGNQFVLVTSFDCPSIAGNASLGYSWDSAHPRHTVMWGDGMLVTGNVSAPTVFHTIAGTVSGLTGTGLVLQNNGADNLAVAASGTSFSFATSIVAGTTYNVTVLTQPSGNTCAVTNGSGIANSDISNVTVSCVPVISTGGLVLVANSGVTNGTNGLSIYRANATTGALSFLGHANTGDYPWAVAVSPNGLYAYVTNLVGGTLSSFSIDNTAGTLTPIPLSSPGTLNPYGIAMDPQGRFLWVANYGYSTVSTFVIGAGGVLSASGSPLTTGSYPGVVTAHPNGNYVYVGSEGSDNISVYSVNASNGTLTLVSGTLTNSVLAPKSITLDPSGQFLYVADSNSIAAFTVNAATGVLSSPRYFNGPSSPTSVAVHPNGNFLYAVGSGSQAIGIFQITTGTDTLTPVVTTAAAGSSPQSISIDHSGSYLYVTNGGSNTVSTFSINASTGALTEVGTALSTGASPVGIAFAP